MKSYVQVLSDLNTEDGAFLDAVSEFEQFYQIFWNDQLLKDFLCSPAVERSKREGMLRTSFEKAKINAVVIKMIVLMLRKNVILHLPSFIESLRDHADERCSIVRGVVLTAVSMPEKAREKVLKALSTWTSKSAEMNFVTEPEILGGIKVTMKNVVLDASIEGKLNEAKTKLKNKRA
jgi:F-type H+-transporting ATPase subunit delta